MFSGVTIAYLLNSPSEETSSGRSTAQLETREETSRDRLHTKSNHAQRVTRAEFKSPRDILRDLVISTITFHR
jgi:hypothetical protein